MEEPRLRRIRIGYTSSFLIHMPYETVPASTVMFSFKANLQGGACFDDRWRAPAGKHGATGLARPFLLGLDFPAPSRRRVAWGRRELSL
jgi:hypothetical protein